MPRFISQKEFQSGYNDVSMLYEGKGGFEAFKQELRNRGNHLEGDPFDPKRMVKNFPSSAWREAVAGMKAPLEITKALAPIVGIASKASRGEASPEEIMRVPEILMTIPKGIGQGLKDSYGTAERLTATLETNPMQVVNDLVTIAQGVAGGLKVGGKALTKAGALKTGKVVSEFGTVATKLANIGVTATTIPMSTPTSRFMAKKSIEFFGLDKHWNAKAVERFAEGLGGTSEKGQMSSLQKEMSQRTGRGNPYKPLVDHGIHGSLDEMELWTKEIGDATIGMKLDILKKIPGTHKVRAAEHLLEDFMNVFSPDFGRTMAGVRGLANVTNPKFKAQIMSQVKTMIADPTLPKKFEPIYNRVKELYLKTVDGTNLTLSEVDEARSLLDNNRIIKTWNEKGAIPSQGGSQVKSNTPAERQAWGQELREELEQLAEKGGFSKEVQKINMQVHGRPSEEAPTLRVVNQQIRDMKSWSSKFGEMKEVIRVATPISRHPLVVMGLASSMFSAFFGAGGGTAGGVAAGLAGISAYSLYSHLIKDPRFMSWVALRTARLTTKDRTALHGFVFEHLKPSDRVSRIFREMSQDAYKAFPAIRTIGRSMRKPMGASASFEPTTTDSTKMQFPQTASERGAEDEWNIEPPESEWKITPLPGQEPNTGFGFHYQGPDTAAINQMLDMIRKQMEQ